MVIVNLSGEIKQISLPAAEVYGEFTDILFRVSQDRESALEDGWLRISPYSMIILE